jgi:hypothetical protein
MRRACAHHPSCESVEDYGGRPYCDECRHQRTEAARYVDLSTTPRECFVARSRSGHWSALREGGAAHWVAHELSAKAPPAAPACLLGYPLRVDDLLRNRREVSAGMRIGRGDIWVDLDGSHCGLVDGVRHHPEKGLQITIRHASRERGVVATDDFHTHFMGRGAFYR